MFQNGFLITLFQPLVKVTKLFFFIYLFTYSYFYQEIVCPHPGTLVVSDGIATLVSNDTTVYYRDQVRYEY